MDIIRQAVELADGWKTVAGCGWIDTPDPSAVLHLEDQNDQQFQMYIDALAAQLARQYHERHPDDTVVYHDDVTETLRYVLERY